MFFGTISILIFCCFIICVPFIYFTLRAQSRGSGNLENDGQVAAVIDKLQRSEFNPQTMTVETKCAICLVDFEQGDKVTQLKCNAGHIFHTECIIGWIQMGKNTCPICRAPIENIDELRNMMEGGELDGLMLAEIEEEEEGGEGEDHHQPSQPQPGPSQRNRHDPSC